MLYEKYKITIENTIIEAIDSIEKYKGGFIIVEQEGRVVGTLTDGDIRRALLNGYSLNAKVKEIIKGEFEFITSSDTLYNIIKKFQPSKIEFLPIVNKKMELQNILTKKQLQELLLQGTPLDLTANFEEYNTLYSSEVVLRPWGFYKTIYLSDFVQCKILYVQPKQALSLQYHLKREEHWVIVRGKGTMTLAKSEKTVQAGDYVYIPTGCEHTILNLSKENSLIISEVQLGSYFGEDDIIRVSDKYGRA